MDIKTENIFLNDPVLEQIHKDHPEAVVPLEEYDELITNSVSFCIGDLGSAVTDFSKYGLVNGQCKKLAITNQFATP